MDCVVFSFVEQREEPLSFRGRRCTKHSLSGSVGGVIRKELDKLVWSFFARPNPLEFVQQRIGVNRLVDIQY